jgi:alkanesulfonate monooxygenase SsuD/methylene tetrahydromethanopterin reductase-like flavin-dependent oxidoreductase (luciferase family)
MRFGLQFRPQDPPDARNVVQRWEQLLEAAQLAESVGFDGVFIPEHHMMDDGYVSSPWAPLGALAAVTERVDIGTAVHLPVLDHPVHVAEHGAMADVLAAGRLKLGCGLGNFEPEFELFGLDRDEQVTRFEECMEVIQRAWSGEELDFHGKHFRVKGKVRPLPIAAELWMAAMTKVGVRRAARFGCAWASDGLHNLDVMRFLAEHYRAARAGNGLPAQPGVLLLRDGWVADSLDVVEREWWPHVRDTHWSYFGMGRFSAAREPSLKGITTVDDLHFDRHRLDRLIVGSPADCIASITRFRDALDMDYLIMAFRMATGPSFEAELECIRRFGTDVIPAFR